jgi:WD40 repeat protein
VRAAWDTESGATASTDALADVFRFDELAWSRNPARNWGAILVDKRRLRVIDVSTGAPVSPEFGPAPEDAEVVSLALSPDAEWLVTAARIGGDRAYELQLWSVREGTPAAVAPMRSSERLQIQDVSADGKKVLALPDRGREPAPLQLWEFGRRSYPLPYRELGTLPSPQSVWARAWGKSRLASFCGETGLIAAVSTEASAWTGRGPRVSGEFSIRLWHAETAQELLHSIRSAGGLVAWRVSPGGREIATVTADGVVTVTDLFWHETMAAAAAPAAAGSSRHLGADRAWFTPGLSTAITARLAGIQYVGGMPISEGTPKLVVQQWRLPELNPLWAQPIELMGNPMTLASPTVAFSPDGQRFAIGTSEARLFDLKSGAPLGRPLAVPGRLLGMMFTSDGERIVLAAEGVNDQGKTVFRIAPRKLDSGEEVKAAVVEWLRDGARTAPRDFAGFTADARHFLRVSAGDRFTGDWGVVEHVELVDLTGTPNLQIRFSRESPAPPALVAAVIQRTSSFEPVSPDEGIARLPAARIRIRSVSAGATLEHLEAGRALIAPPGRSDATLTAVLSADARWIATAAPGRREARVWSTLKGMASSESLVRHTELMAMAFDPNAQHLWQVGRDGDAQASYIGTNRPGKPRWLERAGEGLTSMRLTGQGIGIEWLDPRERRAAQEALLRSLSSTADGDVGATRIKERLDGMLGNPSPQRPRKETGHTTGPEKEERRR